MDSAVRRVVHIIFIMFSTRMLSNFRTAHAPCASAGTMSRLLETSAVKSRIGRRFLSIAKARTRN